MKAKELTIGSVFSPEHTHRMFELMFDDRFGDTLDDELTHNDVVVVLFREEQWMCASLYVLSANNASWIEVEDSEDVYT